jgi:hypothetical protein
MHVIRARKMDFSFEGLPRHWFGGSLLATHLANGLNLLFPMGERFFVRSVRAYMEEVKDDPELLAQVKGFIAQEVRHGMEHERYFETLEKSGYDVRTFLRWYERIAFGIIEPLAPKKLRLSCTVALEHLTATFAEEALTRRVLDDLAPKPMRDLLLWHAAEEIEHKAVAFEVLQKVDPSYGLRVAGALIATTCLMGFWLTGAAMLIGQERGYSLKELLRERRQRARGGEELDFSDVRRALHEYLRKDFHPAKNDNWHLASDYLASVGA